MKRSLLLLGFCALPLLAADTRVPIGDFERSGLQGWQEKSFVGHTDYQLTQDNQRRVLRARSRAAASGLFREQRIDLERTPYLHWSWKVENTLGALAERTKAGDDYPARVYVVVSGGVLFWRTRAVNYVWSSAQPAGAEWPNAFTRNAHMLAVRGVGDGVGRWYEERRDVRADLRRVLGHDVRYIDAVALMTDTDNAGGEAMAYYGDIYFTAE